ncbi:uncharacterized protein [Chelonus insularis]|uniref:uncharacterized protein n=1 Tax=Chelonus insularis TaxID=460826 RepID=UPI00158C4FF1|nr:uncharacterized protein LOC118070597 [Chelonus insularis]
MNKIPCVRLVRINIPESVNPECNTNNFYKCNEVEKSEEAENCVIVTKKVLIFNRKRPGELERVTIDDYERAVTFSESNKEGYEKLSEGNKKLVDEYIRFELGGKKDRNVPVIISREMKTGIDTLLKYRSYTGICLDNPMIFALPGEENAGRYKHLKICTLMREFSAKSGVSNPKTLRTTPLRKHVATTVASLKIAESRVFDISNFMGHAEAIHRQHYRQAVISRDLCEVSQILEVAVGMRQDSQRTTNNTDEIAICNDDANQSRFINELEPVIETTESDEDMRSDSDDSEDSIIESAKRSAKKRKISRKEIREFLKKHPQITRTEAQIRTWIHNQYKSRQQRSRY